MLTKQSFGLTSIRGILMSLQIELTDSATLHLGGNNTNYCSTNCCD